MHEHTQQTECSPCALQQAQGAEGEGSSTPKPTAVHTRVRAAGERTGRTPTCTASGQRGATRRRREAQGLPVRPHPFRTCPLTAEPHAPERRLARVQSCHLAEPARERVSEGGVHRHRGSQGAGRDTADAWRARRPEGVVDVKATWRRGERRCSAWRCAGAHATELWCTLWCNAQPSARPRTGPHARTPGAAAQPEAHTRQQPAAGREPEGRPSSQRRLATRAGGAQPARA